jgi:membrane protein implicated in regulation of membrane protease activity
MDIWIWVWVAVIVISAIIEAITTDLTSIWFTVGGIIALIICICGAPEIAQVIPFGIVSLLCILTIRPVVKKTISKQTIETNISSLVGRKETLITPITHKTKGTIKINDVIWNVVSEDNSEIKANTEIEIVSVSGNKLIVKKVNNN